MSLNATFSRLKNTKVDRESAAVTGVLQVFESLRPKDEVQRLGKRQMSFLPRREGREKILSQRKRQTVHQRSRVLLFPRDTHYANGRSPFPTDRILNVISFLLSSKSKAGAFRQRWRQDNRSEAFPPYRRKCFHS